MVYTVYYKGKKLKGFRTLQSADEWIWDNTDQWVENNEYDDIDHISIKQEGNGY